MPNTPVCSRIKYINIFWLGIYETSNIAFDIILREIKYSNGAINKPQMFVPSFMEINKCFGGNIKKKYRYFLNCSRLAFYILEILISCYYFPKANMDKPVDPLDRGVTQEDLTIQVDENSDDDDDGDDYNDDTEDHGNDLQEMMIEDRHTKKVQSVSGYL
jgi:hypothetical protein